jgi:hypothetical protein
MNRRTSSSTVAALDVVAGRLGAAEAHPAIAVVVMIAARRAIRMLHRGFDMSGLYDETHDEPHSRVATATSPGVVFAIAA